MLQLECVPKLLRAERSKRDNYAIWLVPLFWLVVVAFFTVQDLLVTGESSKELWQVVGLLLLVIALLCIPLFTRTKRVTLEHDALLVQYYLKPRRRILWDDLEHVDHMVSPSTGDRLIRMVPREGRPVLISRAMVNYQPLEEAILRHPRIGINKKPRLIDRWLHDAR